jgi:hypothetical protein
MPQNLKLENPFVKIKNLKYIKYLAFLAKLKTYYDILVLNSSQSFISKSFGSFHNCQECWVGIYFIGQES